MKKVISEQVQPNVRRLKKDRRWEYALINNFWHARKQDGSGDWISIDNLDPGVNPKVKNPKKAIEILNNAFPSDAKVRSTATTKATQPTDGVPTSKTNTQMNPGIQTGTQKNTKQTPTDFNKDINFLFTDNTSITLSPQFKNISTKIISTLKLGDMGNTFMLPNGIMKKVCNNGVTIFTPEVMRLKSIGKDDIDNWCIRDINWKNSTGAIQVPKNAYAATPTVQTGTYTNAVQETNLKSLIKKVLREEVSPKITLKKKDKYF